MVIDFHTHAFPEKVAVRAIPNLQAKINLPPQTDGTLKDLSEKMTAWGIDMSVICNIATNPRQQTSVNNFALATRAEYHSLYALGSIHPDSDCIEEELCRLREGGIRGIKIHPDYMGHDITDKCFDKVFEICAAKGIFIITHAGFDVCSPDHIHATPAMLGDVIDRYPSLRLIAAHFGGNMMFDEVLDKLCGRDIYIDTSLVYVEKYNRDQLSSILNSHDPERILFGSDVPWCPPEENVRFIESFGLGDRINELIFSGNAKRLLGL